MPALNMRQSSIWHFIHFFPLRKASIQWKHCTKETKCLNLPCVILWTNGNCRKMNFFYRFLHDWSYHWVFFPWMETISNNPCSWNYAHNNNQNPQHSRYEGVSCDPKIGSMNSRWCAEFSKNFFKWGFGIIQQFFLIDGFAKRSSSCNMMLVSFIIYK